MVLEMGESTRHKIYVIKTGLEVIMYKLSKDELTSDRFGVKRRKAVKR